MRRNRHQTINIKTRHENMNWVGGRLNRHAGGKASDAQKKKAYFAKVRRCRQEIKARTDVPGALGETEPSSYNKRRRRSEKRPQHGPLIQPGTFSDQEIEERCERLLQDIDWFGLPKPERSTSHKLKHDQSIWHNRNKSSLSRCPTRHVASGGQSPQPDQIVVELSPVPNHSNTTEVQRVREGLDDEEGTNAPATLKEQYAPVYNTQGRGHHGSVWVPSKSTTPLLANSQDFPESTTQARLNSQHQHLPIKDCSFQKDTRSEAADMVKICCTESPTKPSVTVQGAALKYKSPRASPNALRVKSREQQWMDFILGSDDEGEPGMSTCLDTSLRSPNVKGSAYSILAQASPLSVQANSNRARRNFSPDESTVWHN